MKISIVTSAYKKEDVITTQLNRVVEVLNQYKLDYEIIAVVDGVIDTTVDTLNSFIQQTQNHNIKVLVLKENHGKGYALRQGMMIASGDMIGLVDADIDIEMSTLKFALNNMLEGASVVVPSKFHPASKYKASLRRKIISKAYQAFTRILLPTPAGVDDVSCGLKIFKAEVIRDLLAELTVDRFAFDPELMYLVNKKGYRVTTIPFDMIPQENSTADNVKEISIMVKDIIKLAFQIRVREILYLFNKLYKI